MRSQPLHCQPRCLVSKRQLSTRMCTRGNYIAHLNLPISIVNTMHCVLLIIGGSLTQSLSAVYIAILAELMRVLTMVHLARSHQSHAPRNAW